MTIAKSCMPNAPAAPADATSLPFSQDETPDLAASTCGQDRGPPTAKKDGPKTSDKSVPTGPEVHNYMKRAGKRKQVVMHRYKKLELRYTCQLRHDKKTKLGAAAAAVGAQTVGFVSVMVDGVQGVRTQNLLKQKAARLPEKGEQIGDGAGVAGVELSSAASSADVQASSGGGHAEQDFAVTIAGDQRSDVAGVALGEGGQPEKTKKTAFLAKTGTGVVRQKKKLLAGGAQGCAWFADPVERLDWTHFRTNACELVANIVADSGSGDAATAPADAIKPKAQAIKTKARTMLGEVWRDTGTWQSLQHQGCFGTSLGQKLIRLSTLSESFYNNSSWRAGLWHVRDVDFAAASLACQIVNSEDEKRGCGGVDQTGPEGDKVLFGGGSSDDTSHENRMQAAKEVCKSHKNFGLQSHARSIWRRLFKYLVPN
ncbi:unnamed protein product [Amoebophrya sp. A120]|nr:unnamed protein product [Amoebophrya sp. A120]|eukprot:GSA120T00023478001.1